MSLLFLRGMLGLVQMAILPGLLLGKYVSPKGGGPVQKLVFCFALSLTSNYAIVLVLTLLHLYLTPVVAILLAAELFLVVRTYWTSLTTSIGTFALNTIETCGLAIGRIQGSVQGLLQRDPAFGIGLAATTLIGSYWAYDSIAWLLGVFRDNLGDIFRLGDAVLNWNPWAVSWYENQIPAAYRYGQLIPMNWSLTYAFMGNSHIQFFAVAIMPLFVLLTLLLLLDLAWDYRSVAFLIALVVTRYMAKKFAASSLDDGYVDLAVMFFCFLPVYALLKALRAVDPSSVSRYILLGGIFAGASAVTKQAGLYMLLVYPLLTYVLIVRRAEPTTRARLAKTLTMSTLVALVLAAPWYVASQVMIWRGTNLTDPVFRSVPAFYGKPLAARLGGSLASLGKYLALYGLSIVAFPLLHRPYRWIVGLVVIPFTLIWAMFFGYDSRNLALVFPMLSVSTGMGFLGVLLWMEPIFVRLRLAKVNLLAISSIVAAGVLVIAVRVPDASLVNRQAELQRGLFYPALNERIYAELARLGPKAKILSNYRVDFLPGIENSLILNKFDDLDGFRTALVEHPEIRLILISKDVNQDVVNYVYHRIDTGEYSVVAEFGAWLMVETGQAAK